MNNISSNTFTTEIEYIEARHAINTYQQSVNKWLKENKTNGIPVEIAENMPFGKIVNNEMRSKVEVWEFIHNPPAKYFIYIDEKNKTAITWMGDNLGTVSLGLPFKSNLGDVRQQISINAINGKLYHGTYYKSSGNYARIKLAKNQPI